VRNIVFHPDTDSIGTRNQATRDEWLEKTLLGIRAGTTILDAGAGELQYKKFCSHLAYVSQDFCQYDGVGDKRSNQHSRWDTSRIDIVSDITAIPREDESFGAIMCVEVLEHVPDPVATIKELSRLLEKGGWLIITAPFCSLTHQSPFHFCDGFNRYFYEKHLEEMGFEIRDISTNGNFFEYMAQEIRRIPWMADYYCGRQLSFREKALLLMVKQMLAKFGSKDRGSDEMLCLGHHVLARKL